MAVRTPNRHTVLLTSTLPCELGAGALWNVLVGGTHVYMEIFEARDLSKTLSALLHAGVLQSKEQAAGADLVTMRPDVSDIVFLGTYWSSCISELSKLFPSVEFKVYCFDEKSAQDSQGAAAAAVARGRGTIRYLPPHDKGLYDGAVDYVFQMLVKQCCSPVLLTHFHKSAGKALQLANLRSMGLQEALTQPFYTGLVNTPAEPRFADVVSEPRQRQQQQQGSEVARAEYARWCSLWEGKHSLKDLVLKGSTILESQRQLLQDHVKRNSAVVELKDKRRAGIAFAPYLCNLTHESLRELLKTDVTVTLDVVMNRSKILQVPEKGLADADVDAEDADQKGHSEQSEPSLVQSLKLSYRSYAPAVASLSVKEKAPAAIDVCKVAKALALGGGGTVTAAGGSMPLTAFPLLSELLPGLV